MPSVLKLPPSFPVKHPARYPWVVKPKEKNVTIGIGVLCCTHAKEDSPASPRPNGIVMVADTMGSTETDSTGELHKMIFDPENHIYAVCAGRLEIATELFPLICAELKKFQSPRTHGSVWRTLSHVVSEHRSEHFHWDVIATQFAIRGQVLKSEEANMVSAFRAYDPGYQVLFGTFDGEGRALLYYLGPQDGSTALVNLTQFPGYSTIGIGCYNANVWLNYRAQTLGLSMRRSALHAYEASRMASSAPTVNSNVEVLLATKDKAFHFAEGYPAGEDCPLTLPELVKLSKRYRPRSTEGIGF